MLGPLHGHHFPHEPTDGLHRINISIRVATGPTGSDWTPRLTGASERGCTLSATLW